MGEREQAFIDIKEELDFIAKSDTIARREREKIWYPYSDCYVWYGQGDSWTLRISHLRSSEKYFETLTTF